MANDMLPDRSSLKKPRLSSDLHEDLGIRLGKISAMLNVLLEFGDLSEHSYATLHGYLSVISDLTEEARALTETLTK
jgi:hypothetical protein